MMLSCFIFPLYLSNSDQHPHLNVHKPVSLLLTRLACVGLWTKPVSAYIICIMSTSSWNQYQRCVTLNIWNLFTLFQLAKKPVWLSGIFCFWFEQALLQHERDQSAVLLRRFGAGGAARLFPGVGGQLRAFRYFEMKPLPWECFPILSLNDV